MMYQESKNNLVLTLLIVVSTYIRANDIVMTQHHFSGTGFRLLHVNWQKVVHKKFVVQ